MNQRQDLGIIGLLIFICPFDIFHEGRHIYTFENRCKEKPELLLGDGAVKIFLNADSTMDDVSEELRAFLDYVAGKKTEDAYTKRLDKAVKEAKKNREWRHEYMTLLMRDQENLEKGREEGIAIGEDLLLTLIRKLTEDKRFDDITKIQESDQYRQKLYREYHIIN